jgi:hypothetical protein
LPPVSSNAKIVRLITAVIALHVIEVLLWASCYRWFCFSSWESAFYFSASSYATVGYGDVTLGLKWRLYILNPAHPDFARIEFAEPEPFRFDLRLISREAPPFAKRRNAGGLSQLASISSHAD